MDETDCTDHRTCERREGEKEIERKRERERELVQVVGIWIRMERGFV
jgi:hypothetical protein